MLHKDFFVVVLLDKSLLPWERRQWHHLNWLSLCPSETKASSHPGGARGGWGGKGAVCIRDVGPFMCVCLWELNFSFYALWPGCNVANIAVKGWTGGGVTIHRRLCKLSLQSIERIFLSNEDWRVCHIWALSIQQVTEQIRGYKAPGWSCWKDKENHLEEGGKKQKKTRGDVGKMAIVVSKPTVPEFCFTF